MATRGFEGDIVENFAAGVITSVVKDQLPDGAATSAKNSQFYNIGPNVAVIGTRKGAELQNQASSTAEIISQYFLNTDAADYHLVIEGNGSVTIALKKLVSGVLNSITSSGFSFSAYSATRQYSWQTFNDYAFAVEPEGGNFRTDGTIAVPFGIEQPDAGDWSVSAVGGGANLPADTYDVAISYYDETADAEGPISDSDEVVVAGGEQLRVVIPSAATIAQGGKISHVKIYIRRQSTSTVFVLPIANTTPAIDGTSGWEPDATLTTNVDIDCTAAELNAFIILAPEVNTNFPPPTETAFIQNHKFRMFAATENSLYWSKPGFPESFNILDDTLVVGEFDGEHITGMAEIEDNLIIFKRNAIYALIGDDPQTWVCRLVDKTVGCVNANSIAYIDGRLFWMSLRGPQMWAGVGTGIADITTELIGSEFTEDRVEPDALTTAVVIPHPTQNYVAWALRPSGESRNSRIIPFNYKLNRWMASEWEMLDVRSCALVNDSDGRAWPMIGDYDGWIYKVGVSAADGLPSGAECLNIVRSRTSTTITTTGAGWTSSSLIGKFAYVWNNSAGVNTMQRRRITANTTDTITFTPALDSLPGIDDQYAIGAIFLDYRTGFRNGGGPFFKKRIEFAFFELYTSAIGQDVDVECYTDLDEDNPVFSRTVQVGIGGLWDTAVWDTDYWAEPGVVHLRIPVRRVGYSWQLRLLHLSTGQQVNLQRTTVQWLTKTKKVGKVNG